MQRTAVVHVVVSVVSLYKGSIFRNLKLLLEPKMQSYL